MQREHFKKKECNYFFFFDYKTNLVSTLRATRFFFPLVPLFVHKRRRYSLAPLRRKY